MSDFVFLRPLFLWLIPLLLLLAFFYCRSRRRSTIWESMCSKELLPYIVISKNRKGSLTFILLLLSGLLLSIALAGPSWTSISLPLHRSQSGLVIVLDLSKGMDAEDIKPSRLQRAIYKLSDILTKRKEGQTALIVFSGDPFVVTPLTDDNETIKALLPALDTTIMPSSGHQVDKAVVKALDLLDQAGISERSILLVGSELSKQEMKDSIEAAKERNAEISVLGVGTKEGSPISQRGGGFLKNSNGTLILSALQEKNLKGLAEATHGSYTILSADDRDLDALAHVISPLDSHEEGNLSESMLYKRHDQGYLFVLLALPLAVLIFRKGMLMIILFLMPYSLQALSWDDFWRTPDQQAQLLFDRENYQDAKELFQNRDWQGASNYRLEDFETAAEMFKDNPTTEGLYNYGTARAKQGNFDEALDAYRQVLEREPAHEDALYNKKLIEEWKKQQEEQQNQSQEKNQEKKQNQENKENQNKGDQNQEQQDQETSSKVGEGDDDNTPSSQKKDQQEGDQKSNQEDSSQPDQEEGPDLKEDFQSKMDRELESDEQSQEEAQEVEESGQEKDPQRAIDDRWLEKVKDDPGGLLRRKFLWQYRQQNRR